MANRYLTPHFTQDELKCKGTGLCNMDEVFMELLEQIRLAYGRPIWVNSGYRDPSYNDKISSTGRTGPHTHGKAADLRLYGDDATIVAKIAKELGMTGFGWQQKGEYKSRFLHVDNLTSVESKPGKRPWVWTY